MAKKNDFNPDFVSKLFMLGSVASVALAGVGYLGQDIWLASTQWLLMATSLGVLGLYFK